jgi:hypothetical protein
LRKILDVGDDGGERGQPVERDRLDHSPTRHGIVETFDDRGESRPKRRVFGGPEVSARAVHRDDAESALGSTASSERTK